MGVAQLDHEQLVSKIGPYVGSHVTWTPEYIEIDGVIVLVITMDPPHLGDDIHVLRKDLDRYKAGTVFIRRHGQTIQADADEMAMLQRRLLALAPQLELAVEPVVSAIEVMPDFQGPIDRWASVERFRMVATRYQTETRLVLPTSLSRGMTGPSSNTRTRWTPIWRKRSKLCGTAGSGRSPGIAPLCWRCNCLTEAYAITLR